MACFGSQWLAVSGAVVTVQLWVLAAGPNGADNTPYSIGSKFNGETLALGTPRADFDNDSHSDGELHYTKQPAVVHWWRNPPAMHVRSDNY